jgi:hypothetical protein
MIGKTFAVAPRLSIAWLPVLALLLAAAGCNSSGLYPVQGKIVDLKGNSIPGIEGSQIHFSSLDGKISSVGEVQADGSFSLFTHKPGDGVQPGEYEIVIVRKWLDPEHAAPLAIDPKYESFATSGLKRTVEPKSNTFELKIQPVRMRS